MKIGMMTAWNQDAGPAIHAELIGREWVKMGHELRIFSFLKSDFHGTAIVGQDEEYVFRCFTPSRAERPFLNARPLVEFQPDFFVTQDIGMLPMNELAKLFHHITRKAKTITVIHDRMLLPNPSFYQFEWDAIVCNDKRFIAFLKKAFPEEKIHLIPHPYNEWKVGDKIQARKKLHLPLDKKIIMNFGQRVEEFMQVLPAISELQANYPILVLVIAKKGIENLRREATLPIEVREERPDIEKLYEYLHASDAMVLHRKPIEGVVYSSTTYQCLGSGCPIVALNSNFFDPFGDEVSRYDNLDGPKKCLIDIFENRKRYKTAKFAAERVVKANSPKEIATKFIKLFKSLGGVKHENRNDECVEHR